MANIYKNANFNLTTTDVTDVYQAPSNSRAIIQNIHTANVGAGKVFLVYRWLTYIKTQR